MSSDLSEGQSLVERMCVRGLLASLTFSSLHVTTGWSVVAQVSVITHYEFLKEELKK